MLEVDFERRRAALTMGLGERPARGSRSGGGQSRSNADESVPNNAFGRAFDKFKREQD